MEDYLFNVTAGKFLISKDGELFCYFFLPFFILCLTFSGGNIHCIYAAHCQNSTVSWMQHSCPSHILPSMGRTWLPSLLLFPLGASKWGRHEKALGFWHLTSFTRSPYHNPNKVLQNSFRKQTNFPKTHCKQKHLNKPEKDSTSYSQGNAFTSVYIYKSNFLLLKIHLKTKNFVFCG